MRIIGNILWMIFGGLEMAICWVICGLICFITIIGIPLGRQCMKFAALELAPFGKTIRYGGGVPSVFANIIWGLTLGLIMGICHLVLGILWCCTLVGIPIGIQAFKMAKLSWLPFGATVESK